MTADILPISGPPSNERIGLPMVQNNNTSLERPILQPKSDIYQFIIFY